MEAIDKFTRKRVNKYSRMVIKAVNLGVDMEDVIHETREYHGKEFADLVAAKINF